VVRDLTQLKTLQVDGLAFTQPPKHIQSPFHIFPFGIEDEDIWR
jgi:hypothetical protein